MEKRVSSAILLLPLLVLFLRGINCGLINRDEAPKGDYVDIDGVTYFIDSVALLDYFDASAECEEVDMTLVRFETVQKSDTILTTLSEIPKYRNVYMWTSGRYGEGAFRGQWYWGYNKTLGPRITEFDWGTDMPFWPEYNYTSCISVVPSEMSWQDHLCDSVYMGFICQPPTLE